MAEPTFNELVNRAARDLPEGWEIVLRVEKNAAWVDLICPDDLEVDDIDEGNIEADFTAALNLALELGGTNTKG